MEKNYRFCYQENQFFGECVPCTADVFNHAVDDPAVAWKISTRQAVEQALAEGAQLDCFTQHPDFQRFCQRKAREAAFAKLTAEQQLQQWATALKSSLPCFIFAMRGFAAVPKADKAGQPVLDASGQQVLFRRRKQEGIEALSGLFMFDADKLTCAPEEIYRRSRYRRFPWLLALAHKTSSGHGLRLVCEARPELGNIADNQICLARDLGLLGMKGSTGKPVVDDSCIDATRISYCPRREDIYFIDEQILFHN